MDHIRRMVNNDNDAEDTNAHKKKNGSHRQSNEPPSLHILYMNQLSKSWTAETIAALLNLKITVIQEYDEEEASSSVRKDEQKTSTGGHYQKSQDDNEIVPVKSIELVFPKDSSGSERQAKIVFYSRQELLAIQSTYQGIAVPMTHGYHYFSFATTKNEEPQDKDNGDYCIGDSSTSCASLIAPPAPLHLQLLALSSDELERRIHEFTRENEREQQEPPTSPSESSSQASHTQSDKKKKKPKQPKHCRVLRHAQLAQQLGALLGSKQRPVLHGQGRLVDSKYTQPLFDYLSCKYSDDCLQLWPCTSKQRKGVRSGKYMTLRRFSHSPQQATLWKLCHELFESVFVSSSSTNVRNDAPFTVIPPYTALAITHNFVGSPHVDVHDTSFQHVICLSDCRHLMGGELCVDAKDKVLQINIHNRLGRMDGRHVHWVTPWKKTTCIGVVDRYSIVYYTTNPKDYTPPVSDPMIHWEWMQEGNKS